MAVMHRLLATLVALLVLASPALAQKTKANMTTEINTNYPDNTTQSITPSILRTTTIDQVNSFQQAPQTRTVSGVTDTLTVADFGNLVIYNNAGGIAAGIAQATGSFASFNVWVKNVGAGAVTITPTTSQINGSATLVLAQNQGTWIVSDGTNYQVGPTVFAASIFGSQIAASTVANSNLAAMTQNAVKGAASSTAVADLAVPSCSAATSALTWTTNTGFGCNTISGSTGAIISGQALTTTATVTVPANAHEAHVWFTGGSGGSGGVDTNAGSASGSGGAPGFCEHIYTGLTPGNTIVWTQGALGAAGTSGGGNGGTGGNSTITSGTQTVTTTTAAGGAGSTGATAGAHTAGGAGGTTTNCNVQGVTGQTGTTGIGAGLASNPWAPVVFLTLGGGGEFTGGSASAGVAGLAGVGKIIWYQ
jgi:hypothetical protein